MRKYLLVVPAALSAAALCAQTMVSTVPAGRNAVLEELTGVNCPNCPDGHVRADALFAAYPGRVVVINVHGTAYQGTPNLKSVWSDPIDNLINATAYPSGGMNRQVWTGAYNAPPYFPQNPPNNLAIRRPGWWDTGYPGQTAGEWIILNGGNSVVNIGASSTYNSSTNELSIKVELFYTGADVVANKLNVAILQNGVIGYQSGGSSTYNHKNILRDLVTGQWGDDILTTTQGTFITKNYTYTIPANYNGIASDINNMDVVVFVTQADTKTIHTGIKFPAKNGQYTAAQEQHSDPFDLSVSPNPMTETSSVQYSLVENSTVRISLCDLLGQLVYAEDLGKQDMGVHTCSVDRDKLRLSENIYFVTLEINGVKTTRKLVVE